VRGSSISRRKTIKANRSEDKDSKMKKERGGSGRGMGKSIKSEIVAKAEEDDKKLSEGCERNMP
jgi:hypothetical protein